LNIQTMKTLIILTFLGLFGYSFDLTDAIQANEEIAVEINGHPIQAKSLDIVTSESSDRNQCQDKASGCPGWAQWACTNNFYKNWMKKTCPKSCGYCTVSVQCQDSNQHASNCPGWKWACTMSQYSTFMQKNCKKTCGWCSGSGGQTCAKIPSWMKNAISNRIINGEFVPSPIPWQIRLTPNFNKLGRAQGLCGGTILDEETILTAAHCFFDVESGTDAFPLDNGDFILAGITHPGSSGQQKSLMKSVVIHPQYNKATKNNDIAIVKLKSPLTFNNNVKNACLPESSFAPQSKAVVSGWGTTINGVQSSTSNWLKYVVVPFIANNKCVRPHTNYWSSMITSNMICAGFFTGETDSCQGDSGGPLAVPRSANDDTAVVYGVVSWGIECAKEKQPGVYTRVTNYLSWIKANMK